jgi:hypothetical protein
MSTGKHRKPKRKVKGGPGHSHLWGRWEKLGIRSGLVNGQHRFVEACRRFCSCGAVQRAGFYNELPMHGADDI